MAVQLVLLSLFIALEELHGQFHSLATSRQHGQSFYLARPAAVCLIQGRQHQSTCHQKKDI